jgi:hypothetical protein
MNNPTSACPDIGVWRAWLDHEHETLQLEQHLAECPDCRRVVDELREDAALVRGAFAMISPAQTTVPSGADIAVARERLDWERRHSLATPSVVRSREPIPMFLTRISIPWRIAASGLAAALVLSVLVSVTPEGRARAAGFLAQFRSQQVTAVELTPQTQAEIMRTVTALGNLGTINTPSGLTARPAAAARGGAEQTPPPTLAEANQAVGFTLATPDPATLPAGLDKTPRVQVMPASQERFTFDKAKASAYFKSTGHPEVTLPDAFDGATLVVSMPSAALLQYSSSSSGAKEALVLGEAGELVVDVEGKVSLEEMRDFLLGLPGFPPTVVSQLRQITRWNETLPIPIPVQVNWQTETFRGNQGLLLNDNSGVGSAAIWHESGRMYGLAGSLKATQLQRIADGLAVR